MLEPRVPLESLAMISMVYIGVWVSVLLLIWYHLEKRRGLSAREQRWWLIAYLSPTSALLGWMIGFPLVEVVAMGLVTVPFFYGLIEVAARLDDMKQELGGSRRTPPD